MNRSGFLTLAALILFIIAAVLAFLTNTDVLTVLGVIAAGLACEAGASVPI